MVCIQVTLKRCDSEGLTLQVRGEQLEILAGDRWLAPLLKACSCTMVEPLTSPLDSTDGPLLQLANLLQAEVRHSKLETSPYAAAIAKILAIHLLRSHNQQRVTSNSLIFSP